MIVFAVSLIMLSMLVIVLYPLLKNGERREMIAFCAVWLVATVFSLLAAAQVNFPASVDLMKFILGWVNDILGLGGPL